MRPQRNRERHCILWFRSIFNADQFLCYCYRLVYAFCIRLNVFARYAIAQISVVLLQLLPRCRRKLPTSPSHRRSYTRFVNAQMLDINQRCHSFICLGFFPPIIWSWVRWVRKERGREIANTEHSEHANGTSTILHLSSRMLVVFLFDSESHLMGEHTLYTLNF